MMAISKKLPNRSKTQLVTIRPDHFEVEKEAEGVKRREERVVEKEIE